MMNKGNTRQTIGLLRPNVHCLVCGTDERNVAQATVITLSTGEARLSNRPYIVSPAIFGGVPDPLPRIVGECVMDY
jgi:hypothetical protein